jgi:hypothetical protein
MKVGDNIEFYVFGARTVGVIVSKNKDKTFTIEVDGTKYPNVKTFKKLPKIKKQIPPWYIIG